MVKIAENVTNPVAWLETANLMYLHGRYNEALDGYEKALALAPGLEAAKTNKAIVLWKLRPPVEEAPEQAPVVETVPQKTGFFGKIKEWFGR